jgi:hypothetical protein
MKLKKDFSVSPTPDLAKSLRRMHKCMQKSAGLAQTVQPEKQVGQLPNYGKVTVKDTTKPIKSLMPKVAAPKPKFGSVKVVKSEKDLVEVLKKLAKSDDDKHVTVSQWWRGKIAKKPSNEYKNPVLDAGKKHPEHMDDLHTLKEHGHIHGWEEHNKPVKRHGEETYKVHPDGKLSFVHADHDTSD